MCSAPDFGFGRMQSVMGSRSSEAWNRAFLRIGHSGASGHAPANTLKSLALALEKGVDVVEFDVRPCRDQLVLLHGDDLSHVSPQWKGKLASESSLDVLRTIDVGDGERIPTFTEALDLLQGRALINVDLKAAGYERSVMEVLCSRNMLGDVLISSLIPDSLIAVRHESSSVRTGLSYPEDRGGASKRPLLKPVVNLVIQLMKVALPYRVVSMMARARANAVMLNHQVVSTHVVDLVHGCNGRVFAWTVDEPELLRDLCSQEVDGIASNYPELFEGIR
jgi:glycerophosphoryl diester phosphodiesterase